MKQITKKNLDKVMVNLTNLCKEDEYLREKLNCFLDEIANMDYFGSEGQNDPRGDGRD